MIDAIFDRRSIRKYTDRAVPREWVETVLRAGMAAPSSKNRQPWKFIVTAGKGREELLAAFQKGLEREKRGEALLPGCTQFVSGAEYTLRIMAQAPVVILVVNPLGLGMGRPVTPEDRICEICNAQSVGAALENMFLTATDLGLGSLWICDTYFAYQELTAFAGGEGDVIAAFALGFADEQPGPRPRKFFDDVVEWRE